MRHSHDKRRGWFGGGAGVGVVVVGLIGAFASLGVAQQLSPEQLAKAKQNAAHAREFDFWVGDWDVLGPDGRKQGENLVERTQRGWLIEENWKGAAGYTGKSVNFYDAERGAWRQVWMGEGGGLVEYQGHFRDGAMRFEGRAVSVAGEVQKRRSTFTPLEDGRVHQFIEMSNDDGATWSVYFDGYYQRKREASE